MYMYLISCTYPMKILWIYSLKPWIFKVHYFMSRLTYSVYACSGTRFCPCTGHYAAEAASTQCVRTGSRSGKATPKNYVHVPYQPSYVAISSSEIGWVDHKQLCWRAERTAQTWHHPTLEYSNTQSNSADMPCIWQEGTQHPHLPDCWVLVRPVSRGYERPLLPIRYGAPSISGKKCEGIYIYIVYVVYIHHDVYVCNISCICLWYP